MRIFFLGLLSILLCVACSEQHDHKGKTPLVELDGNFLYREDLQSCLLYTSDAADDLLCGDLGGRRLIKKKNRGRREHVTLTPYTRHSLQNRTDEQTDRD